MALKLTSTRRLKRERCQRQPFTVYLFCQDCDEQIEIGDELVDCQVDVTRYDDGINVRLLLVSGPAVCPTCRNLKVAT